MKKLLAVLVVAAMLLTVLTACGDKTISAEKAQEIALEDAGLTANDVTDGHTHVTTHENVPCYNIHFTFNGIEYSYNISADGEILSN